ncbi:MAG: cation-translocating P-type ATPase [Thermofilaceae archaeon]
MWHSVSVNEALAKLGTSLKGLTEQEAEERIRKYGFNELAGKRVNPILMFLSQFKSFLVYILLAATLLSFALGEVLDSVLIVGIIILMAVAGFLQEYKAEKAVQTLKEMAAPKAKVIRDGQVKLIEAKFIVPGDIVILSEGDRVPADLRLIEAENIEVDESPLTGESIPVEKDPSQVLPEDAQVYERSNIVFTGTYVVKGAGKGVVVATGMSTELGKIAASLEQVEAQKTLLEVELDRFGKWIGGLLLALCALVFLLELAIGEGLADAMLTAAALAVAAVPEGLPAIATAILAIGALRMAKVNAIVRKLAAIETLGACNVICSDKTGTITKGEMEVRRIFIDLKDLDVNSTVSMNSSLPESKGVERLLYMCAIYNDVAVEKSGSKIILRGQPTEVALKDLSLRKGFDIADKYPRLRTLHFDRVRKRKSTLHSLPNGRVFVATFGAPELLLKRCSQIEVNGEQQPLTQELEKALLDAIEAYASKGYRTLGAAYRIGDAWLVDADVDDIEKDMVFLAVLAIWDPPREGVKEAVDLAEHAGVRTIIVTGDHELTASAIAKEVGIDTGAALKGSQVDRMSDEELEKALETVSVFARVTPTHKLRIVRALKRKGYVVAMTGDGVNDAPALKAADVGVAMGIKGTDVAKEVADLVLADDNYSTIVEAVKQGRIIYENVKKPIDFLLSCNLGEVFAVLSAELLGLPVPLSASQLLWINLVTDSLPALALGLEPEEPGVMERPPRGIGERLISLRRIAAYTGIGALTASLTIFMLLVFLPIGIIKARTAAFAFFCLGETISSYAFRSEKLPFFKLKTVNKLLFLSILAGIALSLIPIYTPLSTVFELTPLTFNELLEIVPYITIPFVSIEAYKLVVNFNSKRK